MAILLLLFTEDGLRPDGHPIAIGPPADFGGSLCGGKLGDEAGDAGAFLNGASKGERRSYALGRLEHRAC